MSDLLDINDLRAGYGEAVVIPKMTLQLDSDYRVSR